MLSYFKIALKHILRSGARSWLAISCVAFGVFTFTGLKMMSESMENSLSASQATRFNADISFTIDLEASEKPLQIVDSLKAANLISNLRPFYTLERLSLHSKEHNEFILAVQNAALDTKNWGVGVHYDIETKEGNVDHLEDITLDKNHILVRKDVMEQYNFKIDDSIVLNNHHEFIIKGIVFSTSHLISPQIVFSNKAITEGLIGSGDVDEYQIFANAADINAIPLNKEFIKEVSTESQLPMRDVMNLGFMATALLGLLVSGIAIANTMRVTLAKRNQEIASLKTLGYKQLHLLYIFIFEGAILGVLGSLIGIIFAIPASEAVLGLISKLLPYTIQVQLTPEILTASFVIGISLTVIFGFGAAWLASEFKPIQLLRDDNIQNTHKNSRLKLLSLFSFSLVLFYFLSVYVLSSFEKAFYVLGIFIVAISILYAIVWLFLQIILRLPITKGIYLKLARKNLQYNSNSYVFSIIALTVGVFAIGLSLTAYFAAQKEFDQKLKIGAYNVVVMDKGLSLDEALKEAPSDVYKSVGLEKDLMLVEAKNHFDLYEEQRALDKDIPTVFYVKENDFRTIVPNADSLNLDLDKVYFASKDSLLSTDVQWLSFINGYDEPDSLQYGGTVDYKSFDDFFSPNMHNYYISSNPAIATDSTLEVTHFFAVKSGKEQAFRRAYSIDNPSAEVIIYSEIKAIINQVFLSVFNFVMGISSLAFIAGALLISNSVGLSVITRRKEMGLFKAIGYSSNQVLFMLIIENAMVGFLSALFGNLLTAVSIVAFNLSNNSVTLDIEPTVIVALFAISMTLSIIFSIIVALRPSKLKPLSILRSA